MNTINQVNLSTSDLNGLAHFFAQVFDFRTTAEHPTGNFVVMTSESGFVLTLMMDNSLEEKPYPAAFHVGFLQPDCSAVLDLHTRIQAVHLPVPSPGSIRRDTFGFYVYAPGGVLVEVSCGS
jgi:catechol-2,3-dioxygenase